MDKWTAYLIIVLSKADKELLKQIRAEFEAIALKERGGEAAIQREFCLESEENVRSF